MRQQVRNPEVWTEAGIEACLATLPFQEVAAKMDPEDELLALLLRAESSTSGLIIAEQTSPGLISGAAMRSDVLKLFEKAETILDAIHKNINEMRDILK